MGRWCSKGLFVLVWPSRVHLEGQQLLGVHVVERAQVGQLEQQLGKDGRLVGVVPGDEAAQSSDQRLLQRLHGVHVLEARAIWKENGEVRRRTDGVTEDAVSVSQNVLLKVPPRTSSLH